MKKTLTTVLGALVALTLLATACGGSDGPDSSDQAVIDAVAAQLRSEGDVPDGVDVDCMAAAMVTGLGGAEKMASEYGLTVESINAGQEPDEVELPKDQAISLAGEAMECGLGSVIASEMTGGGLEADAAECLLENLDQDAIRDMMATEFMNAADAEAVGGAAEDAMFGSLLDAMGECDLDLESLGG